MDNVWQYVTQLFGHIMSPKLLNMAYCTYGLNQFKNFYFLGLSYGLGISSKMTKCAISTFVTKYSWHFIPIFTETYYQNHSTYLHEMLARIKADYKPCFRCIPTDSEQ